MSNDRFKFRVWDNHYKRYGLPPYIRRNKEVCYIYDVETPQENPELVQHHFILEQCTGLTDKNGKLIFEGDVLLFNGSRNPVYFDDGSFVILHSGSVFIPIKQKYTDVFEIIGNVHEMESEQ